MDVLIDMAAARVGRRKRTGPDRKMLDGFSRESRKYDRDEAVTASSVSAYRDFSAPITY